MLLKVVPGIVVRYLLLGLWRVPGFPPMGEAVRMRGGIDALLAGASLSLFLVTGLLVQCPASIYRRLWTWVVYLARSYLFAIPVTVFGIAMALFVDWSEVEASTWYFFVLCSATLPGAVLANYANHRLVRGGDGEGRRAGGFPEADRSGAGRRRSGRQSPVRMYPRSSCSARSRPSSSSSGLTRSPMVALIARSTISETTADQTTVIPAAASCLPSWPAMV